MKHLVWPSALVAAGIGAGASWAQTPWTQDGVTFEQRAGWCATHTLQENIPAMETRPCDAPFPYLSVAKVLSPADAKNYNIADLLAAAANNSESDDNRASVAKLANDKFGACAVTSFKVDRAPFPGISGYATLASFNCPKAPDNHLVDYRNYSTLVVQPNGAMWALAFDYPVAPITDDDIAMIRNAIGRIASAP